MNLRFKDTIRILKTCDKVDTGIIGCMAFMYKVLMNLNSATLQFNIIYKCLSNKKLPRILPCQNFHLP